MAELKLSFEEIRHLLEVQTDNKVKLLQLRENGLSLKVKPVKLSPSFNLNVELELLDDGKLNVNVDSGIVATLIANLIKEDWLRIDGKQVQVDTAMLADQVMPGARLHKLQLSEAGIQVEVQLCDAAA